MISDVKIVGAKRIQDVLGTSIKGVLEEAVFDTAAFMDMTAAEKLQEKVYDKPESPVYRRTGSANKGRLITGGGLKRKVIFSSKLGGAQREYTKFLNRNKRIKKLNTGFFDDSVDETKEFAGKQTKKILHKRLTK